MKRSSYLLKLNLILIIVLVFVNVTPLLYYGPVIYDPQLPTMLVIAILILVISKRRGLHLRYLAICMVTGAVLLYAVSMIGFYSNSYLVPFGSGGTWVPDHSIGTAALYSQDTTSFIASFFGYSCNGVNGANCSIRLDVYGLIISEATVIGSIAVGDVLVIKDRKKLAVS